MESAGQIEKYVQAFGEQDGLKSVPCLVIYWSRGYTYDAQLQGNVFLYFLNPQMSFLTKVGFSFLVNITGKLFTATRPSLKDVAGNTMVTWSQIGTERCFLNPMF